MSNFRDVDRQTGFLLPPSVDEWLSQRHLARFVVEVIDGLDLRAVVGSYRGSGSASYHPSMLLGCWFTATRQECFRAGSWSAPLTIRWRFASSRRMTTRTTTRSRLLSLSKGRRRFLKEIEGLFVKVLLLAREMGVLNLGTVALDGTKIHANASRHSALSYDHAGKLEAQLKAEVAVLLAKAEAADSADLPDGMSIPEELERREERTKIEARASERLAREQAEYEAKIAARAAKAEASGKKPGGKPPASPAAGSGPTDQINLTDEASRIMPVAGGGFEQCCNAQALVTADSLLVVAGDVVQAANDKQQLEPMLGKLAALPADLDRPETILGDNGYFSAANVTACRGRDRAATGARPRIASPVLGPALCPGTAGTAQPDAAGSHGAPLGHTRRQEALRSAQAHCGASVRHHQIGSGLSTIPAARAR